MPTQTKSSSHGLLFSEPSIAETGVWCEISDNIDPAEWAYLCRYIGNLSQKEFKKAQKRVFRSPDSILSRLRRVFSFEQEECEGVGLVELGYCGYF